MKTVVPIAGLVLSALGLTRTVPGHGVVDVERLEFRTNLRVEQRFWVDEPGQVHARAYWPGGRGSMLTCIPTSDGWACGDRADAAAPAVRVHDDCT